MPRPACGIRRLVRSNLFRINDRWPGARWHGREHVLLALDQRGGVVAGLFETVAMSNGVGGTSLDAITAEDTAGVIDVVDLGVALAARDAGGFGVLGRLDIDAIGGTGRGAEKAGHAFLHPVLVALQHVRSAVALL